MKWHDRLGLVLFAVVLSLAGAIGVVWAAGPLETDIWWWLWR